MILKEELFPVGKINKTHGTKGELNFSSNYNIFEEIDIPFLIMEPEGLLVPFYIESVRMINDENGIIKLERVDSDERASEFIGETIYLSKIYMQEIEEEELALDYFIGFEIIDTKTGRVGRISSIDESTENILFIVENDKDELFIPATDDFIIEIDHEKNTLIMDLPLGLIEL